MIGSSQGTTPMSGWLARHLEEFVKPVIGQDVTLPAEYKKRFKPYEMSVIKNIWRKAKHDAAKRPILLAGRDVWLFEVLARRENYPTVFRPDISRLTVNHVKEDYSNLYLFDTGFAGSIPRGLKIEEFSLISHIKNTNPRELITDKEHKQAYPRLSGSRSLALKIEYLPKYWKSGFWREDKGISQELADKEEFLQASYLTIEVYKDSSPAFTENVTGLKSIRT